MRCETCGSTENLTKDHIIPKWIYKRASELKLRGFKKVLGKENIQVLCSPCNSKKRGSIAIVNQASLDFWLSVRQAIDREVNATFK